MYMLIASLYGETYYAEHACRLCAEDEAARIRDTYIGQTYMTSWGEFTITEASLCISIHKID